MYVEATFNLFLYFFKKVQKIPISIEIVHFLFLRFYSINLHVFIFKILFNFLHSE